MTFSTRRCEVNLGGGVTNDVPGIGNQVGVGQHRGEDGSIGGGEIERAARGLDRAPNRPGAGARRTISNSPAVVGEAALPVTARARMTSWACEVKVT